MSSWTPKKWVVLFFPICFSKKALDFGATPVDTHTVTESAGFGLQKFEEWKESSFWVGVLTNRYGSSFTQKTSWKKYGPSPVEVGSFSPLFIGFGYISSGAEFQPTRVEIRGSPWSPCALQPWQRTYWSRAAGQVELPTTTFQGSRENPYGGFQK